MIVAISFVPVVYCLILWADVALRKSIAFAAALELSPPPPIQCFVWGHTLQVSMELPPISPKFPASLVAIDCNLVEV